MVEVIQANGALFFDEIVDTTRMLPAQVEEAIAELVALGILNSDSFGGLRALLLPSERRRPRAVVVEVGAWRCLGWPIPVGGRS